MTDEIDPTLRRVAAIRLTDDHSEAFNDNVIDESAIALLYNGCAHAVMMATPRDLEDFALGFTLSEGIVDSCDEWRFVEAQRSAQGFSIEMTIPQSRFDALQSQSRLRAGNSACGICGIESLQAALQPLRALRCEDDRFGRTDVHAALHALSTSQPLNDRSGGVHAAGFANAGQLLVREDVGRHNALDKLIGARARTDLGPGFVVMTSRASYELVHKTAHAGIAMLVTVSAPTTAAIDLAESCGLTLIAFARERRMNVYTHRWRVD